MSAVLSEFVRPKESRLYDVLGGYFEWDPYDFVRKAAKD